MGQILGGNSLMKTRLKANSEAKSGKPASKLVYSYKKRNEEPVKNETR
jgi:hypothetical protein